MSELKTLKDIKECGCCFTEDQEEYGCMKPELKEEAIKWVKELRTFKEEHFCCKCREFHSYDETYEGRNCGADYNDGLLLQEVDSSDISGAIQILKGFFNIIEDDLK